MAEQTWLDAMVSDDEDDSSYVSSSGSESSESEMSEVSNSREAKKAVKAEVIKARAARVFEEMQAEEASMKKLPASADDMYKVFNSRFERPPKDTSAEGVFKRIDLEHPVASAEELDDFKRYKRRETSAESTYLKRRLPELLQAVEHEFVEVEEDGIFAGQVVKLKRKVSVHSEEAQRFLKRQKRKPGEQVSALDSYLESMKVKTVNTMGKTAADWSQFKETQGLSRDLEVERKRGYLVDQAFLAKVNQNT